MSTMIRRTAIAAAAAAVVGSGLDLAVLHRVDPASAHDATPVTLSAGAGPVGPNITLKADLAPGQKLHGMRVIPAAEGARASADRRSATTPSTTPSMGSTTADGTAVAPSATHGPVTSSIDDAYVLGLQ